MHELNDTQLAGLAERCFSNREIEAVTGSRLSATQQAVVDRARVVAKLRRAQKRAEPKSNTERTLEKRERDRAIERRTCEDQKRRTKLERDPAAWLKWYMGSLYYLGWSPAHREMIEKAVKAFCQGRGFAVAAPRGEGKSAVLRGVTVYLQFTGRLRVPILGSWTARHTKTAFAIWKQLLSSRGSRLAADYPEFTQPFEISTNTAKLKNLTWKDTGDPIGASVDSVDHIIILPDSKGAIIAGTVNGDVKGVNVVMPNGEVLRPDGLLLDDCQDSERADQKDAVQETIDKIESQWFCLSGPDRKLTPFVACTVKEKDDVSEYWLKHPDFDSVRVPRVLAWPAGWEDKGSDSKRLWTEFDGIRSMGIKEAAKFYRKNKRVMTAGMKVSWRDRYDKKRGEPDAIFSAMWDFYRVGEKAFASEYQNNPLDSVVSQYGLSVELIQSRADQSRKPFEVPDWATACTTAATDINHYGLHSGLGAFGMDDSCAIAWYGCYDDQTVPKNASETERNAIIYSMLTVHGRQMRDMQVRPSIWLIDGGYAHGVVQRYVTAGEGRNMPFRVMVARGFGASQYRPFGRGVIGQPRERCHHAEWPLGRGVAYDADYWREIWQRSWLGKIGEPGACSLFAGDHRDFREQVCRERLREKIEGDSGWFYKWETAPGRHDYGDVGTMLFVGAAYGSGIGPGGSVVRQKPKAAYFSSRPTGKR